ncbi:hypothetical protein F5Y15DRAFT_429905 [Xylariaceae sp. FL0016]|nr:hypothetical protein F5Y15DRAFT_429905 [Xylariaceae sp. FL0016]
MDAPNPTASPSPTDLKSYTLSEDGEPKLVGMTVSYINQQCHPFSLMTRFLESSSRAELERTYCHPAADYQSRNGSHDVETAWQIWISQKRHFAQYFKTLRGTEQQRYEKHVGHVLEARRNRMKDLMALLQRADNKIDQLRKPPPKPRPRGRPPKNPRPETSQVEDARPRNLDEDKVHNTLELLQRLLLRQDFQIREPKCKKRTYITGVGPVEGFASLQEEQWFMGFHPGDHIFRLLRIEPDIEFKPSDENTPMFGMSLQDWGVSEEDEQNTRYKLRYEGIVPFSEAQCLERFEKQVFPDFLNMVIAAVAFDPSNPRGELTPLMKAFQDLTSEDMNTTILGDLPWALGELGRIWTLKYGDPDAAAQLPLCLREQAKDSKSRLAEVAWLVRRLEKAKPSWIKIWEWCRFMLKAWCADLLPKGDLESDVIAGMTNVYLEILRKEAYASMEEDGKDNILFYSCCTEARPIAKNIPTLGDIYNCERPALETPLSFAQITEVTNIASEICAIEIPQSAPKRSYKKRKAPVEASTSEPRSKKQKDATADADEDTNIIPDSPLIANSPPVASPTAVTNSTVTAGPSVVPGSPAAAESSAHDEKVFDKAEFDISSIQSPTIALSRDPKGKTLAVFNSLALAAPPAPVQAESQEREKRARTDDDDDVDDHRAHKKVRVDHILSRSYGFDILSSEPLRNNSAEATVNKLKSVPFPVDPPRFDLFNFKNGCQYNPLFAETKAQTVQRTAAISLPTETKLRRIQEPAVTTHPIGVSSRKRQSSPAKSSHQSRPERKVPRPVIHTGPAQPHNSYQQSHLSQPNFQHPTSYLGTGAPAISYPAAAYQSGNGSLLSSHATTTPSTGYSTPWTPLTYPDNSGFPAIPQFPTVNPINWAESAATTVQSGSFTTPYQTPVTYQSYAFPLQAQPSSVYQNEPWITNDHLAPWTSNSGTSSGTVSNNYSTDFQYLDPELFKGDPSTNLSAPHSVKTQQAFLEQAYPSKTPCN